MINGRHLFEQPNANLAESLKNFKVYKSCPFDNTYERNYYNGSNSTIQLLVKNKPLNLNPFKFNEKTVG